MKTKRLTPAQRHFCDEWLKDHNGTRAYLCAYPRAKKVETAWVNASRLLSLAKVRGYIRARQAEMAKKFKIDQERVLREEACIAFSNIAMLFEDGKLLDPNQIPEEMQRAIRSIEIKDLPDGGREYRYRFWDKGRALDRISKHLGMYEKDNRQKNPSLEEVYSAFKKISPELAEAVRDEILASIGP